MLPAVFFRMNLILNYLFKLFFLLQIMFFKYNPIKNSGLRLCYSLIYWLLL